MQNDLSDNNLKFIRDAHEKVKMASEIIHKIFDEPEENRIIQQHEILNDFSLLNLIDYLNEVKYLLEIKTSDHPTQFSLPEQHISFALKHTQNEKEKIELIRSIKSFGEVGHFSHQYPDDPAIRIANMDLSLKEAEKLNEWLANAIQWHKSKGHDKINID